MKWPGTTDPHKRKEVIRFLIISTIVGAVAVILVTLIANPIIEAQPHHVCIDDVQTPWRISFTFEMIVDGVKAEVQPNIGITEECQRAIYTLSNDGTVYAEWKEDPNFELGHFLWISEFPIRDMVESEIKVSVDGKLSEHGIKTPIQDGRHYKAEFTSKDYDSSKDRDFLPELGS